TLPSGGRSRAGAPSEAALRPLKSRSRQTLHPGNAILTVPAPARQGPARVPMATETWPGKNWCPDLPEISELLARATVGSCELLPSGSNYVFLVELDAGEAGRGYGVYKPRRGEAPLW